MWSKLINFKSRHKLALVTMGHQIGSFSDQALNGSEKDPVFSMYSTSLVTGALPQISSATFAKHPAISMESHVETR